MKARDIMTTPVITISMDSMVAEAADLMIEKNISCLPVLDEKGKLAGILTHTDFGLKREVLPHGESLFTMLGHWAGPEAIEQATEELKKKLIAEVMKKDEVTTVEEDTPLDEVVKLMVNDRVNRLPVMRGGEVVGIVTRHDILKLLSNHPMSAQLWTPALR